MEKLSQLQAEAAEERTLGPDRRRHPAGPVGARLPRRARAAVVVPRRAADPGPARAGAAARPGSSTAGMSDGDRRDHQGARRPDAARRADVRGGVRHAVRRLPRAGRRRPTRSQGPARRRSWSSPRPTPTRCARRRSSSSGSPAESMPLAGLVLNRLTVAAAVRHLGPGGARGRRAARGRATPLTAGAAPAARRPARPRQPGAHAAAAVRGGPPAGRHGDACRRWRPTSTTSTRCARSPTR